MSDAKARKRWLASAGSSLIIYGIIGVVVATFAGRAVAKHVADEQVDVTFRAELEPEMVAPEPPPPPPPQALADARRTGRKPPSTPTEIPDQAPAEAEPTGEAYDFGAPIEDFGDGLAAEAIEAPPPPPPPPPDDIIERAPPPVETDERITPAVASDDNALPIYPESARKKGIEHVVSLRITISSDGQVIHVKLLSGAEPFATAATAAVRTWRYRPARLDGKPTGVTRVVNIPFKIRS